ncbi:hypothetical protein L211DRAFT_336108 [Terfezia boudieri ATCC MYA-4762]|uniref:Cenp-O kinetochore centromere component n=1 Tax=Terfezia boudieri ATCC MYA-4762 TaxID=1051890 RepID=A0A3N4LHN3_9PEZI|nr:hypothetical protein L211DRAFT_336108 [Terfezia boudieri ATCC MYA-4762]
MDTPSPHPNSSGAPPISPSLSLTTTDNNCTVDLAALEAQVRALESQKAQLTAQLTSLQSTSALSTLLPTPPPSSPPPDDATLLSTSLARSNAFSTALISTNYRLAGTTAFLVHDPSPPGDALLGIRIESFTNGQFGAPHYLILSARAPLNIKGGVGPGGRSLSLRHATVPPFFNLPGLAAKYLPLGIPAENQRLDLLVRELRRKLAGWNRRGEVLERLRMRINNEDNEITREVSNRLGLGKPRSIKWDEARLNLEIWWEGVAEGGKGMQKVVGTVRLLEDGSVDKSVVVLYDEEDVQGKRGGGGQRMRKVERMLKTEGLQRLFGRVLGG